MKRTSKISSSSKVDSKNQASNSIHPSSLQLGCPKKSIKDIQLRLHLGFGCHHIIHPQVNWRTTPTSSVSSSYISPLNADTHSYLSSLLFSTTLAEQIQNHKQPTRSYWRWSRQDFFPEESFQNLASYRTALLQTCFWLKDRLLSRSSVANEVFLQQRESENPLKKCLTWWDLAWMSFGSVVGSGIFVITGQETLEIPVAGGSFSYLRVELGDFVAFLAAGNILLEAIVGAAGLARSWSSYFASMINTNADFLRIRVSHLADGFNLLDPIAAGVLLIADGIAMCGTRETSILNWISSVISFMVILFIIIIGFIRGKTSNLVPFFPYGARGVFRAAAVVYWSYTGFDMVATMAEETKNPTRDIPLDVNAAYAVVFERLGMKWAKYLVSICALKGMTTSLLIGGLGQARYMTQIARAHMIPPWRYYVKDTTVKRDLVKFLACLFVIIGSSIGIAVLWNSNKTGWIGYAVAAFIWFLGTLGMVLLPKQRVANVWGVPLVPWLPSLSVAMNLFLVGSLGYQAFLRFVICSAVMLIYYLFIGLHATYDVARQNQQA
ncbi:Cationic amino acid transporter 8, vacuolar [Vitis vinifera]|uniref:Cationic amino acid transporter 8, vacuolar n=1 Tax=Vitis vinifera TaxID=29760 RepID=A0A438CVM2_VITVI|nr:Cationic amino acid transporter 8, vacuolar [Vitis vinifera]